MSRHEEKFRFNPFPKFMVDYESFNQSMNEDMGQVGYTVLVNLIIAVLFLVFFSYGRMSNDKLYAPKVDIAPRSCPQKLSNRNMFSWMYELWSISDDTILRTGGFDTLTFIRFYRINLRIFAAFAVYAFMVLLPVNGTGGVYMPGSSPQHVDSFQRWSMTNIQQSSQRCWFHLLGIILLTAITVYYLENEFVHYAKSRHRYLRQRHAHLRTVLVEGIPLKMRSNTTLALYFEVMYPNAVQNVILAQDLSKLEATVRERDSAIRVLESYLHQYRAAQLREGTSARRPNLPVSEGGARIDAIQHYMRLVERLNAVVAGEQVKARHMARRIDTLSEDESLRVIEGLLRVTESGSLDKMLRSRKCARTPSSKNLVGGDIGKYGDDEDTVAVTSADETQVGYGGSGFTTIRSAGSNQQQAMDVTVNPQKLTGVVPLSASSNPLFEYDDLLYESFREEYADDEVDEQSYSTIFSESGTGSRADSRKDDVAAAERDSLFFHNFRDVWQAPGIVGKLRRALDCFWPVEKSEYVLEEGEVMPLIRPLEERLKFLPKAFVTFKTFTAAAIARQVIHMQLAGHMAISEAPEPRDVWWPNLYLTRRSKNLRTFLVECFVVALIVFWVVPITLMSHITGLKYLQKVSWIQNICDASPLARSLLGLLQPAAIVGVMHLLPPLFQFLGDFQGCVSFRSNQFSSFDRYFLFQVVNVFLVTTVAGSVADAVASILTSPATGFELLGNSLPKMGGYFTTFIFIKAFIGLGMELTRLAARFQSIGKELFSRNSTLRERREASVFNILRFMDNPGALSFATVYAQDALIVVLCMTFANVAPLLLVSGIIYFGAAGLVYTHQLLFVYTNDFETGGRWWPKIARCMVIALLFGQCTMVGMMLLKGATYHIFLILTVLIAATVFYLWRMKFVYEPLGQQLPFDLATSMDLDKSIAADHSEMHGDESYLQPELQLSCATAVAMVDFPIAPGDRVSLERIGTSVSA
jgi:hypothetical protein